MITRARTRNGESKTHSTGQNLGKYQLKVTFAPMNTLLENYCSFGKLEFLLTMKLSTGQLKSWNFMGSNYEILHIYPPYLWLFPCLPRTHLYTVLLGNGNADYLKFKAHISMMLPLKDSLDCTNFPLI